MVIFAFHYSSISKTSFQISLTLWETNIAMENGAIEDVFPFEDGDIPFLCQFTSGEHSISASVPKASLIDKDGQGRDTKKHIHNFFNYSL